LPLADCGWSPLFLSGRSRCWHLRSADSCREKEYKTQQSFCLPHDRPHSNPLIPKDASPKAKVTPRHLPDQRYFLLLLDSSRTVLKFPLETTQSLALALKSSVGKNGPAVSARGYFKNETTKSL